MTRTNDPRYQVLVLVSRSGSVREMTIRRGGQLPLVIEHGSPRLDGPTSRSVGQYVRVPLVDSQGRLIYVQRW